LQRTLEEIEGYDEMIALRGIRFESHCEHHSAQRRHSGHRTGCRSRSWVNGFHQRQAVGLVMALTQRILCACAARRRACRLTTHPRLTSN